MFTARYRWILYIMQITFRLQKVHFVYLLYSPKNTHRQMWKVKQGQNTFSNKLLYMTWIAETEITNAVAKLNTQHYGTFTGVFI